MYESNKIDFLTLVLGFYAVNLIKTVPLAT